MTLSISSLVALITSRVVEVLTGGVGIDLSYKVVGIESRRVVVDKRRDGGNDNDESKMSGPFIVLDPYIETYDDRLGKINVDWR